MALQRVTMELVVVVVVAVAVGMLRWVMCSTVSSGT
jgi:hypothetical protein